MNMTKKMIYHTYANLKPIKASVLETVRKQTAKVLWVTDKTGSCKCEYCEKESKLENTKHLSKAKCPECGRKLEVRHLWRKHSHYDVDWRDIQHKAGPRQPCRNQETGHEPGFLLVFIG